MPTLTDASMPYDAQDFQAKAGRGMQKGLAGGSSLGGVLAKVSCPTGWAHGAR